MLRSGLAVSAVFVAIVACSSSAAENDSDSAPVVSAAAAAGLGALEHRDGTRLKVQTLGLSDGTRVPYAFYDTTTNEQCSMVPTSAGMRCVPSRAFQHGAFYASDAACTKLVTNGFVGCAKPTLAYGALTGGACGTVTYELYAPTAAPPLPAGTQLYYATGTGCYPVMKSPAPLFEVARIAPDGFPALTQREPTSASRLRREVMVGADGSELVKYFPHDTTTDRDCSTQAASADAPSACMLMAYDGSPTGEFTEATCSQPAYSTSCSAPRILYDTASSVRRAGAPVSKVYRGTTAACGAASTPVAARIEGTGPAIPFAPLTVLPLGTGRVQGSIATNEAGEAVGLGAMIDTKLHANVYAQTATDGQSRFIPISNAMLQFADAACTTPIVQSLYDTTPADRVYVSNPRADLCDGISGTFNEVYTAAGTSTTPAEVYMMRDTGCTKVFVAPTAKYYPARKMLPTELEPATLSFEPVGAGDGGAPLSTTDAGASSSGSILLDAGGTDASAVVDSGASSSGTTDAGHSSSSSSSSSSSGSTDAGHGSSSSSSSGSSSSSSSSGAHGSSSSSSSSSGYGGIGVGTTTEATAPGSKPADESTGCAAAPTSPARGLTSLLPTLAFVLASRRRRKQSA